MAKLEDLREWLTDRIDGGEEMRGEDGLISHFINQIDALPSEIAEPRGCPTPGACSCPGTIPDTERKKIMTAHMLAESIVERGAVDTPVTDAVVKMMEAGWLSLGSSAPGAVKPLVETMERMERELIDLKQRLLPQFQGRAQRAERDRDAAQVAAVAAERDARFAKHERDAMLEQLMVAEKRVADQMTTGVPEWVQTWREHK